MAKESHSPRPERSQSRQPPAWVRRSQQSWANTGTTRPTFAIEPGEDQESVWDYPRPPVVVPDSRQVVITSLTGTELARTSRSVRLLETASPPTFYLPAADINMDLLTPTSQSSMCEWKGAARYFAVAADAPGADPQPVAWTYPDVWDPYRELVDHVAFYPARVRATVNDEVVRAQAGGFYGGWITNEVIGPFKGDPGTGGW